MVIPHSRALDFGFLGFPGPKSAAPTVYFPAKLLKLEMLLIRLLLRLLRVVTMSVCLPVHMAVARAVEVSLLSGDSENCQ